MSADLIIQSGTKLALHQWLVARGFGTLGDAPDYDLHAHRSRFRLLLVEPS
jgi:hypothetical protein